MRSKLYHYTKLILIPVIGNLYRLIYQAPANVIRFLYDFFRENPSMYMKALRKARRSTSVSMGYAYDGINDVEIFTKWPTYTKTVAGIMLDKRRGNCMDYAHFFKWRNGGKIFIYIPDLNLTKVHYLVQSYHQGCLYTTELVKSGEKQHPCKTARQVMEERYPNNTIYRVW